MRSATFPARWRQDTVRTIGGQGDGRARSDGTGCLAAAPLARLPPIATGVVTAASGGRRSALPGRAAAFRL